MSLNIQAVTGLLEIGTKVTKFNAFTKHIFHNTFHEAGVLSPASFYYYSKGGERDR